ncbi:MAG: XrtA system polysaccharide deacetylase [Candidatus Zixiibacteriota bacterium]
MQPNLLTVDLEEWFVVEALADRFAPEDWVGLPSTLQRNVMRLLRLFARQDVQATWFVLGWCAERHPALINRIAEQGHEVACHSYSHRMIDRLSPDEFRLDTRRAINAITEATGIRPVGYRAPSWSMSDRVPWAFEILAELGFEYDSSIFPIKHDLYGMPDGPRHLFRMTFSNDRFLYELPATTIRRWGQNVPVGGGGYLRHSPYWYTRHMMRKVNDSGHPVMVYVHPWELDPDPPAMSGLSLSQRLRSYGSTGILEQKLDRLLSDFTFVPVIEYIRAVTRQRIGFER